MAKEKQTKVTDFIQDDHNFNKGTEQGEELIAKSFRELGAGRSILVDKNNRIIAGNKSQKAALEAGIENARIIESDGNELIVVKRTDIDLDSAKGRKLALADNTTNKINLDIDEEEIEKLSAELDDFNPEEWGVNMSEDTLDMDGFFNEEPERGEKPQKKQIMVLIPAETNEDEVNDIRNIIVEALKDYKEIEIK